MSPAERSLVISITLNSNRWYSKIRPTCLPKAGPLLSVIAYIRARYVAIGAAPRYARESSESVERTSRYSTRQQAAKRLSPQEACQRLGMCISAAVPWHTTKPKLSTDIRLLELAEIADTGLVTSLMTLLTTSHFRVTRLMLHGNP